MEVKVKPRFNTNKVKQSYSQSQRSKAIAYDFGLDLLTPYRLGLPVQAGERVLERERGLRLLALQGKAHRAAPVLAKRRVILHREHLIASRLVG